MKKYILLWLIIVLFWGVGCKNLKIEQQIKLNNESIHRIKEDYKVNKERGKEIENIILDVLKGKDLSVDINKYLSNMITKNGLEEKLKELNVKMVKDNLELVSTKKEAQSLVVDLVQNRNSIYYFIDDNNIVHQYIIIYGNKGQVYSVDIKWVGGYCYDIETYIYS